VNVVDGSSKRSVGDTIGRIAAIVTLIAILVVAVVFLVSYVDSHDSSAPASTLAPLNISCCTSPSPEAVYHPGEVVHLVWTPVEAGPDAYPKTTITLTAFLSNSYPGVMAIKSSTRDGTFSSTSGPFIAAAPKLRVSSRSVAAPVMRIAIPHDARTGYYDIVTAASQPDLSVTSGMIIKVRR
jgi:hypothetical protein